MSKERLEEMEELLNEYYGNLDDPFASTDNAMAIIDKVGYFVKRVQDLEKEKERYQSGRNVAVATKMKMDDLEQQNKRYREALELIADKRDVDFGNDYTNKVYNHSRNIARKALEELK